MAFINSSTPGVTAPTPANQYPATEQCTKSAECMFRNVDGTCVHETCLLDELPPMVGSRTFKCMFCDEEDTQPLYDMKGPICKKCLEYIKTVGDEKEWKCIFCGKTKSGPRPHPFLNVCDECITKIKTEVGL